jgi:hypothetical protein
VGFEPESITDEQIRETIDRYFEDKSSIHRQARN